MHRTTEVRGYLDAHFGECAFDVFLCWLGVAAKLEQKVNRGVLHLLL
jgi:hypothetical protein